MPATLRGVLLAHRDRLLAGAAGQDGAGEQALAAGAPDAAEGLPARIASGAARVRRMLEDRAPLEEVAFELGRLSHSLADANDPLLASDADPREPTYRDEYARYLEKQLQAEKFRVVFTGYRDAALQRGDADAFACASLERARRHYARIGQDFYRDGKLVDSGIFDEFSFAFGVGQLAYSHAVGDVAKLWFRLWEEAGGDTGGLPIAER
jgi:hypothetical protein